MHENGNVAVVRVGRADVHLAESPACSNSVAGTHRRERDVCATRDILPRVVIGGAMSSLILNVGSHGRVIKDLFARSRQVVRIASPYVTHKEALRNCGGREVRLLTHLTKMDVVTGATSLGCLQQLLENGVRCRVITESPRLHAKVYIFDDNCAVVTSANLTESAFERNIEVGVQLNGQDVAGLVRWFDERWDSVAAEPLKLTAVALLRDETDALRAKFKDLRDAVSREHTPSALRDAPHIKVPSPGKYFLCNTDRRHGRGAEKIMHERDFAIAWEPYDYAAHFKRVGRHDMLLMYANGAGIIAIGAAEGTCEVLESSEQGRVLEGNTSEWRVRVKWIRWVSDPYACPWKPHTDKTFVDVSSDRYAARRDAILKHFAVTRGGSL